jgi:hypothetical protein
MVSTDLLQQVFCATRVAIYTEVQRAGQLFEWLRATIEPGRGTCAQSDSS